MGEESWAQCSWVPVGEEMTQGLNIRRRACNILETPSHVGSQVLWISSDWPWDWRDSWTEVPFLLPSKEGEETLSSFFLFFSSSFSIKYNTYHRETVVKLSSDCPLMVLHFLIYRPLWGFPPSSSTLLSVLPNRPGCSTWWACWGRMGIPVLGPWLAVLISSSLPPLPSCLWLSCSKFFYLHRVCSSAQFGWSSVPVMISSFCDACLLHMSHCLLDHVWT